MDFGGIFRNMFRGPSRTPNKEADNSSAPHSHTSNPDIYDDTDLARFSRSPNNPENRAGTKSLPTFRDTGENDGGKGVHRKVRELAEIDSLLTPTSGMNFVFGEMFSIAREMLGEMERSMSEMDDFFRSDNFSNFSGGGGVEITEITDDDEITSSITPNRGTIRQNVLKREDVPHTPPEERIDHVLDDLYPKNSKVDLSKILGMENGSSGGEMEKAWKEKERTFARIPNRIFQYNHTIHQYNSDGTIEGKTIRETNEGREIKTYWKNKTGEIEENVEFIPRGEGSVTDANFPETTKRFSRPFQLFDFFFPRPRM